MIERDAMLRFWVVRDIGLSGLDGGQLDPGTSGMPDGLGGAESAGYAQTRSETVTDASYQPALRLIHWPNRTLITGSGPEWVSLRAGWYQASPTVSTTFPVPPHSGQGLPSTRPVPLQVRQMFSAVWGALGDAPSSWFPPGPSVPGTVRLSEPLLICTSLSGRGSCLPDTPLNRSADGDPAGTD